MISLLLVSFLLVNILHTQQQEQQIPKIIWSYLESSIKHQQSIINHIFRQNHMRYTKQWQYRLINQTTAYVHLSPIPYFDTKIYQLLNANLKSYSLITQLKLLELKRSYIKYLIISYYGGVWIDSTVLLVEDLSWLYLDSLRVNKQFENTYKYQPQIVLFSNTQYFHKNSQGQVNQKAQLFQQNENYQYQLFFIAAKPNTLVFQQFMTYYSNYVAQNVGVIKKQKSSFVQTLSQQQAIKIQDSEYFLHYKKSKQIFQQALKIMGNQLQIQLKLPVSVLYKISHLPCQVGPLILPFYNFTQQITSLNTYTKQQFIALFNITFHYMIHIHDRFLLLGYLRPKVWLEADLLLYEQLGGLNEAFFCSGQFQLYLKGFLYQYGIGKSEMINKFKTTSNTRMQVYECPAIRQLGLEKLRQFDNFKRVIIELVLLLVIFIVVIFKTKNLIVLIKETRKFKTQQRVNGSNSNKYESNSFSNTQINQTQKNSNHQVKQKDNQGRRINSFADDQIVDS